MTYALIFCYSGQLQYEHVAKEHVPGDTNTWLTFMLPLGLMLLISVVRRSLKEAHHSALAIWSGNQLNNVATSNIAFLENCNGF